MVDPSNKTGPEKDKPNVKDPVSAHSSTLEMYEISGKTNIPTIFDRYNARQAQYTFGAQGIPPEF